MSQSIQFPTLPAMNTPGPIINIIQNTPSRGPDEGEIKSAFMEVLEEFCGVDPETIPVDTLLFSCYEEARSYTLYEDTVSRENLADTINDALIGKTWPSSKGPGPDEGEIKSAFMEVLEDHCGVDFDRVSIDNFFNSCYEEARSYTLYEDTVAREQLMNAISEALIGKHWPLCCDSDEYKKEFDGSLPLN
jgi:hypothetical protein